MPLLYGLHDREAAPHVPNGGWCVDTRSLSANEPPTDYAALRGDINWIVRLNWGYGSTGTIPLPDKYQEFANACAHYVAKSRGANIWIIGNEPNHEQERPNNVYITPEQYARCFKLCRDAIKRVDPNARVIPAPCAPYHANPVDWLVYWRTMLDLIAANGGCDGIAVHAYTRSSDPKDISSGATMGPPLQGQYSGFLTYQDALEAVPDALAHLPAYITEINELLPEGWDDRNTGVVRAMYSELDAWNLGSGNYPKIYAGILYRWPKHDKWYIEGKRGVIDDFNAAVGRGYQSPPVKGNDMTETLYMPQVSPGTVATPDSLPPRDWDARLTARGVTVETPPVAPGQKFWRVVKARWYDEKESQGRHHIYVEAPADTPFWVVGKGSETHGVTNDKTGFDAANVPMWASEGKNGYSVWINDDKPNESLEGVGMGADTPGGFNAGIHTSTGVTFQLVTMPAAATPPIEAPQPVKPAPVPPLVHPIADPTLRVVSQRFGENPQDYARFGLKGHNGVDFAVPMGTRIRAVDDGEIVESLMDEDGYGQYIKIRHKWGESLYAHLWSAKAGGSVRAGDDLGDSGNTGNSTGPHLHFGLRVNPYTRGAPFDGYSDPLPYLQSTAQSTPTDVLGAIKAAAQEFGLEWQLLASQAWAESSFDPRAVSKSGAKGLMQIMPNTWAEQSAKINAGNDPFDLRQNARVGAKYMQWLIGKTEGSEYDALAAYGWGIGNWQNDPNDIPEAWANYASKIIHGRDLLMAVSA